MCGPWEQVKRYAMCQGDSYRIYVHTYVTFLRDDEPGLIYSKLAGRWLQTGDVEAFAVASGRLAAVANFADE